MKHKLFNRKALVIIMLAVSYMIDLYYLFTGEKVKNKNYVSLVDWFIFFITSTSRWRKLPMFVSYDQRAVGSLSRHSYYDTGPRFTSSLLESSCFCCVNDLLAIIN